MYSHVYTTYIGGGEPHSPYPLLIRAVMTDHAQCGRQARVSLGP